jgi:type IV pilus assembly protein PilC
MTNRRCSGWCSISRADVEGGTSLHEALAKHPLYFDDLFVNLVEAGEQSGALESLLDKVATYKEKSEAVKKKVKKALFYPAAVLVVAVDRLAHPADLRDSAVRESVQGLRCRPARLHADGRESLEVRAVRGHLHRYRGRCGGLDFHVLQEALAQDARVPRSVSLKLPIIGPILNKAAIARYARTLSTMFAAGVPLVEALESVAGACGNIVYENGVMKMRDEVATGQRLQRAMENTGLFPNMVVQMIAVGEESGSLDTMSGKVATFYEEDVDAAVDSMSSLLEPLIMAILGVLVGGMVIAMYLPIFKLGSVV